MERKPRTPPLTFTHWLKQAKPGERLTYHIDGNRADDKLFSAAWEAHLEGKVALFQKREGRALHYIAQRLSARSKRLIDNVHRITAEHVPLNVRFPKKRRSPLALVAA